LGPSWNQNTSFLEPDSVGLVAQGQKNHRDSWSGRLESDPNSQYANVLMMLRIELSLGPKRSRMACRAQKTAPNLLEKMLL
jgi:hypothetical protein